MKVQPPQQVLGSDYTEGTKICSGKHGMNNNYWLLWDGQNNGNATFNLGLISQYFGELLQYYLNKFLQFKLISRIFSFIV